jgi:hypothetical protein
VRSAKRLVDPTRTIRPSASVFDYSSASSYTIRATEKATLFWREGRKNLSPDAF